MMSADVSIGNHKEELEVSTGDTLDAAIERTVERMRKEIEDVVAPILELDDQGVIVKANMQGIAKYARYLQSAGVIPERYQGRVSDCMVAIEMAMRFHVPVLVLMCNSYMVHDKLTLEGKFTLALLNLSGKTLGPPKYDIKKIDGKIVSCRCSVVCRETQADVDYTIDRSTVEQNNWEAPRRGKPSPWVNVPDLMFRYRSATYLIRAHFPEVLMGIPTRDEMEDVEAAVIASGEAPKTIEQLKQDAREQKAREQKASEEERLLNQIEEWLQRIDDACEAATTISELDDLEASIIAGEMDLLPAGVLKSGRRLLADRREFLSTSD